MRANALPIGIQDFQKLILGGYLYVDKTEYYHSLIASGSYYFLSRPRRFGKSLLISTLKAIFEGRRELFEGLWIHDKIDWEPRPVILLDFSEIVSREIPLGESLGMEMDRIARSHGVPVTPGNYDLKFRTLIKQLGADRKVAILVDEYDKPIISFIDQPDKADENRDIMKNFYASIKANDASIAFMMISGVSKFSHVSIFSDLNHLQDISLNEKYSQMLGYTHEEILKVFPDYLAALNEKWRGVYPDVMAEMKAWYNGYSWDGIHDVYNPFSILNLFATNRFGEYWFATGTPTFLMKLIKSRNYGIFDIENCVLALRSLSRFDVRDIGINSLLFQTGYLTIKKYDDLAQIVILNFPNKEVSNAFSAHLLAEFSEKDEEKTNAMLWRMASELRSGAVHPFVESLRALFSGIAYPIQPVEGAGIENFERYYHSMFYLVLRLLGYNIQIEVLTHNGRIDAVISTERNVYVVEFKLGDAATAMAQIKERGYHQQYLSAGKTVMLLGIGFDVKTRNVGDFVVEVVETA